jgi:drug/metabolite transporter (DMT)-like permease
VRRWFGLTPIDGLLLLMVVIWGSNFSIVKAAIGQIPHLAFNALRLALASAVFLALIAARGAPALSRRDWAALALLGLVGHFVYQLAFMGGIALTTASNSSLILGGSPVAVALASAVAGHERIPRAQWAGVLLSSAGIYLVVGTGARFSGASLRGDLLTLFAVACWAAYTVGSRSLLIRMSPLVVTGFSMAFGTLLYVPLGLPALLRLDWRAVTPWAWLSLAFSSLLALNVAYLIWYTAVQRIGNVRTSAYSNITPIVALTTAALFLGEHLTTGKIAGAAAILGGVVVTRVFARTPIAAPPEE